MEEYEFEGYWIEIKEDDYPESPRYWDNLGIMIYDHRNYSFGDIHYQADNASNFEEWFDEYRKENNIDKSEIAIRLPIYAYIHSGVTISTTPFSYPWDSGQVGYIYVTKEMLRREYGIKRVTKKYIEKATKILEEEIKTYDQYMSGDIYKYFIYDSEEKNEILDSCSGFYSEEYTKQEAESMAKWFKFEKDKKENK